MAAWGQAALRFWPGSSAMHADLGAVSIIKVGTSADFCNDSRIYVSYQKRGQGRGKRGMQTHHMWVLPATLTMPAEPEPSPCTREAAAREQQQQQQQQQQQGEQEAGPLPERAPHERARKLPQRPAAAAPKQASGSKRKSRKSPQERSATSSPSSRSGHMARGCAALPAARATTTPGRASTST